MRIRHRGALAGAVATACLLLLSAPLPAAASPDHATPSARAQTISPAGLHAHAELADAAAPTAAFDAPGLRVELTALEPAVVHSGATVTVQGTVLNELGYPVSGLELDLQVHSSYGVTRAGLYQFLSTGEMDGGVDHRVGVLPLAVSLDSGQSTDFSVSFPADELPDWERGDWGPRGLTVSAHALTRPPAPTGVLEYRWPTDQDEDGPEGWARTFLILDPGQTAKPVGVGVLAPLVATSAELATALRSGAPISRVSQQRVADLAQAGSLPGITLAVDPMLLQPELETSQFLRADLSPISALGTSARRAPSPFIVSPSPAPPTPSAASPDTPGTATATPAARLSSTAATPAASASQTSQASTGNTIEAATPAASASQTPQASAATDPWASLPLAQALRADDELMWLTPWDVPVGREYPVNVDWLKHALPKVPAVDTVAWADAATWDPQSLTTALQNKRFAQVIAPIPAIWPADDAPPATSLKLTGASDTFLTEGVEPDRPLSLAAAGRDLQGHPLTQLERRQLVIAHTALLSGAASAEQSEADNAQNPGDSSADDAPIFLAAIERGSEVSAADLAAISAALEASPWAKPVPLSSILTAQNGRTADMQLAALDTPAVSRQLNIRAAVESLESLLPRPSAESAYWAVEGAAAQLSSAAWAHSTNATDDEVFSEFHNRLDIVNRAVGIDSPPTINLIDSSAQVPLTMYNPLPLPVQVELLLTPNSAHLQFEEVTVSLAPNRRQVVHVPVKAVGNADVNVIVELYGHSGHVVGTPTELQVRVRADWEKLGFGTISAIGLSLFALALMRNYIKRRHTGPGEENSPGEPANSWIPPRTTQRPPLPDWARMQETDERQDG